MPKTSGEETKKNILQVAEKLFAEKGFNGTSVNTIAKTAGVNKALIYYYFKDKNDIIVSLFKNIVNELVEYINQKVTSAESVNQDFSMRNKLKEEIKFFLNRKKIISIMLMEALKADNRSDYLFQCAEIFINHEFKMVMEAFKDHKRNKFPETLHYMVYEFFTGIIPMITFVALQDKWCEHFHCDQEKLLEYFIDSFEKSHLSSHLGLN